MKNKAVIDAEELARKECEIILNKTCELIASVVVNSWKESKIRNDVKC